MFSSKNHNNSVKELLSVCNEQCQEGIMKQSISSLKEMQEHIVSDINIPEEFPIQDVKLVAGFSTSCKGDKITCSAIIVRFPSEEIIEKKTILRKAPINYVPGLEAFRDGPIIMELYYSLEYTPDVILLKGHGIAHPQMCGIASFIGVETQMPTIGIAVKPLTEIKDDILLMDGKCVGVVVKTREYSNPLYVSPGSNISFNACREIIMKLTHYPHKLPEPLHLATRMAKKGIVEKGEEKNNEEEFMSEVAR
ncbi:endonuclease V [Candidatus Woesearchaeota archaeon]|nr:endonuclease V [Candidatus Woesearchaeota archaeon]